jgi:hypothetical protein
MWGIVSRVTVRIISIMHMKLWIGDSHLKLQSSWRVGIVDWNPRANQPSRSGFSLCPIVARFVLLRWAVLTLHILISTVFCSEI